MIKLFLWDLPVAIIRDLWPIRIPFGTEQYFLVCVYRNGHTDWWHAYGPMDLGRACASMWGDRTRDRYYFVPVRESEVYWMRRQYFRWARLFGWDPR